MKKCFSVGGGGVKLIYDLGNKNLELLLKGAFDLGEIVIRNGKNYTVSMYTT
jgi:hypothetical protein